MKTEKEIRKLLEDVQNDMEIRRLIINQDALKTMNGILSWVLGE